MFNQILTLANLNCRKVQMATIKSIFKIILKTLYWLQLLIFTAAVLLTAYVFVNTDQVVVWFAHYLVVEKNIHQADVIVVTSGEENELRIAEGIRLLQEGYSDHIIFSGYDLNNKAIINAMTAAGFSDSSYTIENQATSTIENATCQQTYVAQNQIQSMLVIFSPPQSRRGLMAFNHTYPDLDIYVSYSDASSYKPDAFFDSKETREMFNEQTPKFFYYFIKYAF